MRFLLYALADHFFLRPPEAARVGWLRGARYAHRGLHGPGVPENSTAAFAAALEAGMGIECDVQRTADGQALVFHDFDLDRMTGEPGAVRDRSLAELAGVRLAENGEAIPTLRALLAQVKGAAPLLIEVKSRKGLNPYPLCLAVRRELEGYRGPVGVMSFDPRVPRWFARSSPHVVRGLVASEDGHTGELATLRKRLYLWWARPDFLAWDVRDLPSRLAGRQRKRGLPLLTWTVRDEQSRADAAAYADAPIAEGAGVA